MFIKINEFRRTNQNKVKNSQVFSEQFFHKKRYKTQLRESPDSFHLSPGLVKEQIKRQIVPLKKQLKRILNQIIPIHHKKQNFYRKKKIKQQKNKIDPKINLKNEKNFEFKVKRNLKLKEQKCTKMCKNFETKKSDVYSISLMGSKHVENQDSIGFSENIFIVCDGHGINGKSVSEFVTSKLMNKMINLQKEKLINEESIQRIFKQLQVELSESFINISLSGCTCLMIVKVKSEIFCVNVGDSRAIICCEKQAYTLTISHKPFYQEQRYRIEAMGGVIHPIEIGKGIYSGPDRIWAPGKRPWGPGLALSRVFGDQSATRYGVISQPDIEKHQIKGNNNCIVMGSDGLFDKINDQTIASFVHEYYNLPSRHQLCQILTTKAKQNWGNNSDDISCILIFL